jgi:hypothetical protein
MGKGTRIPHVLIAVTRDETDFRAVEVRRHDQAVEIAWARTAPVADRSWGEFAGQCGFSVDAAGRRTGPRNGAASVVGLDMNAVALYQLDAPHVSDEETGAIVRMQAESLLPLPPDQMEVAWRTMPSMNGKVDVTLAAARRDTLVKFAEQVRDFQPRSILLSCEGMARAWLTLFGGQEGRAVLVSLGVHQAQVCLVFGGVVANAAVVETGMAELSQIGSSPVDVSERFIQDMHTALAAFGWKDADPWPIVVFSDGGPQIDQVVTLLGRAGLEARTCLPAMQRAKTPTGFSQQDFYAYRGAIGLALLGLDAPAGGLDLFEQIRHAEQQKKDKIARHSTWLAAGIAAVALIAFLASSYAVDAIKLKRLSPLVNQAGFAEARERQVLLKTIAANRPDVLDLLTEIHAGDNPGIVLDSFHFRKGQLVTIMGQADTDEQMRKFQRNLMNCKSKALKDVDILPSTTKDSKTKKIKFTMNLSYKNFTRKGAA